MKIGDTVKRTQDWIDNIKEDCWLLPEEESEVGVITAIDEENEHIVVQWGYTGESWEDKKDLELVEKRGR